MTQEQKQTFWEFIRYCVVGGTAFLCETATHFLLWKFALDGETSLNTFIATAAGFVVGLIVNYALSVLWVFTTEKQKEQGRNMKAFIIFTVVGLVGFGLKELLMNAGAWIFGVRLSEFGNETVPYYATHIVSAGIVLIWNYIGRKIFVFKKEKQE